MGNAVGMRNIEGLAQIPHDLYKLNTVPLDIGEVNYKHLGCFNDNTKFDRAYRVNHLLSKWADSNPVKCKANCAQLAKRAGMKYFGIVGGSECYIGNKLIPNARKEPGMYCNQRMASGQIQGGLLEMDVYEVE